MKRENRREKIEERHVESIRYISYEDKLALNYQNFYLANKVIEINDCLASCVLLLKEYICICI